MEAGHVVGVLDLDSPLRARFDEIDQAGCERLVTQFLAHHRPYLLQRQRAQITP
jgi:putative methionine-R-sulfoxide reductase with GAF domain